MSEISALKAILNSLNSIEVKGKENMDYLLGCIQLIEQLIKLKNTPQKSAEEGSESNGRQSDS